MIKLVCESGNGNGTGNTNGQESTNVKDVGDFMKKYKVSQLGFRAEMERDGRAWQQDDWKEKVVEEIEIHALRCYFRIISKDMSRERCSSR